MDRPINERVAVLESQNETILKTQLRISEKLDDIVTKLNAHPPCPEPGSCLRLVGELTSIKSKIEVLEADRNQRKGERGVIAIVCTIIGALVSFFANLLVNPR